MNRKISPALAAIILTPLVFGLYLLSPGAGLLVGGLLLVGAVLNYIVTSVGSAQRERVKTRKALERLEQQAK